VFPFTGEGVPGTRAELGRQLFFDPILSRNYTISCASCHKSAFAFSDTVALSRGVDGKTGTRNTPSAMNVLLQQSFFWDGRARSLEEQALAPIENPDEMDLPLHVAIDRLKKSPNYSRWFRKLFGREPNREDLATAIAAFEKTLETSDSPFDNWKFADDPHAVSDAARRGFAVFNGKGKCSSCHFGADFTQPDFRNIGLFDGKELNDSGRMKLTRDPSDLGKFKIGSLRNVAITAPYMHNGMFRTLKEVIVFYNDPARIVPGAINRDSLLLQPLGLTTREMQDLEAFLFSLTDKRFIPQLARQLGRKK
jgi:cytochrome c peroxidase